MKILLLALLLLSLMVGDNTLKPWTKALQGLTPLERAVIVDKATQKPFVGEFVDYDKDGIYRCKVCSNALYSSSDKFDSSCGWPSFDDAVDGAITQTLDSDGKRTEIVCSNCDAHLGHVFAGEGYTEKNLRHCVNSISMTFEPKKSTSDSYAYFAGGCFWGVEYYLEKLDGVKSVASGFMGGEIAHPSYHQVLGGKSGHLETVEVTYDSSKISYEKLAKRFFEIHDPTQKDGQGPDIGEQYLSAIFVSSPNERKTIENLVSILESKDYHIATKIIAKSPFYKADEYHQDYYQKNNKEPYCHAYIKRF